MFGKLKPVALAYAAPDDAGLVGNIAGRYDQWTAVYDISAHKVYLPDGSVLEAHSGRGSALDDPGHTNERMQGSTPVNIYDLKPRESLFHGVEAIRLIPVDESQVFGRSGFLAHTYMLGPNGEIVRLRLVPQLRRLPTGLQRAEDQALSGGGEP